MKPGAWERPYYIRLGRRAEEACQYYRHCPFDDVPRNLTLRLNRMGFAMVLHCGRAVRLGSLATEQTPALAEKFASGCELMAAQLASMAQALEAHSRGVTAVMDENENQPAKVFNQKLFELWCSPRTTHDEYTTSLLTLDFYRQWEKVTAIWEDVLKTGRRLIFCKN